MTVVQLEAHEIVAEAFKVVVFELTEALNIEIFPAAVDRHIVTLPGTPPGSTS